MSPEELERLRQEAQAALDAQGASDLVPVDQVPPSAPAAMPGFEDITAAEMPQGNPLADITAVDPGADVAPAAQPVLETRPGENANAVGVGAHPQDSLGAVTPAPVEQAPPVNQWHAMPGAVNGPGGRQYLGDGPSIANQALNDMLAHRIGQEDYQAVLNALNGASGQAGAAGAGGGGFGVSIQQDLTSPVDPRAMAQLYMARQARIGGENAVRQSAALVSGVQAAGQLQQAQQVEQQADRASQEHKAVQADVMGRVRRFDDVMAGLANASIDPDRLLNTGGNRLGAVLAVALGSLGALAGQPNQALAIIDNSINRDIHAQETALRSGHMTAQMASRGLEQFRQITRDDQAARDAYRAAYLQAAQLRVGGLMAGATGEHRDRLMQLQQLLEQERILAAQAVPHRIGQVTISARHQTQQGVQSLLSGVGAGSTPARHAQPAAGRQDAGAATPLAPQPGAIPGTSQLDQAAVTQQLTNLPGLGQVPASPEVRALARRNPTAAAALHRTQARSRAPQAQAPVPSLTRQQTQELQSRGQAQAEHAIPRFDNLTVNPQDESRARLFMGDPVSARKVAGIDHALTILPRQAHQLEALRESIHARLGNAGGLLNSREFVRARAILLQMAEIRQQATGRGVRNVGDEELLQRELPDSRWSSNTLPTDMGADSVDSVLALVEQWMGDMSAEASSMGFRPNTVEQGQQQAEARRNAATGRSPASLAQGTMAGSIGDQPPVRGQ